MLIVLRMQGLVGFFDFFIPKAHLLALNIHTKVMSALQQMTIQQRVG